MTENPDENDHEQHDHAAFIPFSELPEEMQQHLNAAMSGMSAQHAEIMAAHNMAVTDMRHRAFQHFDTLSEDQLRMQMILLQSIGRKSAFWIGYLTHLAWIKFGICPADGQKHDEELAEMGSQDGKAWVDFVNELPDEVIKNMGRYNMGFIPGEWPKVKCNGCQNEYMSLEDRMVKGPDDCHFCQQKSAWG